MRPLRACAPALLALALTACGGEATTSTTSTSVAPGTTSASSAASTSPASTTADTPPATPASSTSSPVVDTPASTSVAPATTSASPTTAAATTSAAPAGQALSAADAARILVTADQLPGGPWEAGQVESQPQPWFPPLGDLSKAGADCRTAMDRLVAISQGAPTAHASRVFHGKGFVPEQIRATLQSRKDAAEVPALLATIGSTCRSETLAQGGEQTTLQAATVPVATPGGAVTKIRSTRQGRSLDLVFGAVDRGQTLAVVVADGPQAVRAVPQVLQAQVTRLERAPR